MKHMKHVIDNGTEIEIVVRNRREGKNVGTRTNAIFGLSDMEMGGKKRKRLAEKMAALSESMIEYLTVSPEGAKDETKKGPSAVDGVKIDTKRKKDVKVLLDPNLDAKWKSLGEETAKLTGRNKVRVVRGTIRSSRFYPSPQGNDIVVQGVQGAVLNSWKGVVVPVSAEGQEQAPAALSEAS